MRDISNRPNGTNGKLRRWILRAAEGDGGVTSRALADEFGILFSTAASHMRKLRQIGLIEATEVINGAGAMANRITADGRAYLAANADDEDRPRQYDHEALAAALGMR